MKHLFRNTWIFIGLVFFIVSFNPALHGYEGFALAVTGLSIITGISLYVSFQKLK